MRSQDIVQLKLLPALAECSQHQQRLHTAWVEASEFDAFKRGMKSSELNDAEVRILDQLVFRFGRLQDAMGSRLLPALLQLAQEWQDNEPFIDKLNRAEKLGMLPSVEQWLTLRELRNQTAHDYPAQAEIVMANLQLLVKHVPVLELAYQRMVTAAQNLTPVASSNSVNSHTSPQ